MGDINTSIDHSKDLTIHKVYGKLNSEEFLQAVDLFYLKKIKTNLLWDLSEGGFPEASFNVLQGFISKLKSFSEDRQGGKTAVVAADDYDFGMARMFELSAEDENYPIQIKAFRNVKDAMQWLGE